MATAVRASRHRAGMERSVVYTEAMPGPDGNAGDNWNSDPRLDKGENEVSADFGQVKRSIRSLF